MLPNGQVPIGGSDNSPVVTMAKAIYYDTSDSWLTIGTLGMGRMVMRATLSSCFSPLPSGDSSTRHILASQTQIEPIEQNHQWKYFKYASEFKKIADTHSF